MQKQASLTRMPQFAEPCAIPPLDVLCTLSGTCPEMLQHTSPVLWNTAKTMQPLWTCTKPPQAVDLFGSRDFLTSESAEAALRTMLAPGSQVSKVGPSLSCVIWLKQGLCVP